MAVTLKKKALFWDALLFLLIGLTVSMAVLSVGPLVAFGFLLMPPLIAHLFARNMRQFALIASAIGGVSAFAGFCIAFRWDYPVGPTDVALLGLIYGLAFLARKAIESLKHTKGAERAA
jgi:ABC-type Mn2+/Zn2+ transport system permease subunit